MSPYPTDHAGLEILSFDRCLELLATVPVGRVGFLADGEIVVLPVNYLMDGVPLGNSVSWCELGFCCGIGSVAGIISGCCCRSYITW